MVPSRRTLPFLARLTVLSAGLVAITFSLIADWHEYSARSAADATASLMTALIAITLGVALFMLARLWRSVVYPAAAGSADRASVIPAGYAREYISRHGVTFCYPQHWLMTRSTSGNLYAQFQEPVTSPGCSAPRNFNIACQSIEGVKRLDVLFAEIVRGGLSVFPEATLAVRKPFHRGALHGFHYRLRYRLESGCLMSCHQWGITSRPPRVLVIVTFTMREDDAVRSRDLLDTVIRSIVIQPS